MLAKPFFLKTKTWECDECKLKFILSFGLLSARSTRSSHYNNFPSHADYHQNLLSPAANGMWIVALPFPTSISSHHLSGLHASYVHVSSCILSDWYRSETLRQIIEPRAISIFSLNTSDAALWEKMKQYFFKKEIFISSFAWSCLTDSSTISYRETAVAWLLSFAGAKNILNFMWTAATLVWIFYFCEILWVATTPLAKTGRIVALVVGSDQVKIMSIFM
jgi:hypothetical protein